MANSSYTIIDEPRAKAQDKLITHPVVILLVAMILPLFWNPPYLGRFWMPFVWLIMNGYLLGSPTLKKEVVYSLIGLALLIAIPFAVSLLFSLQLTWFPSAEFILPYMQIMMSAVFFLFLFLVVNTQAVPYEIFSYIQEQNQS